ncbi:MAG: peptide chain release factor-like protein [Phycisphaerae bacterium]|nr:peptide chain release factor-like protein [Phycisphaerae bacterium]
MTACGLREEDIEERFIRGSGPGGQKINKTASCVYLKHLPTGLSVKMQKVRVQPLNRFYARRRMCELLEQKVAGKTSPQDLKQEKLRKQKQRRKRRTKKKLEE